MGINYKETKDFKIQDLENLFNSVDWISGKYPDKLQAAMKNSDNVISAWDEDKLIGLMSCLSDKVMTAYFHYLLVDPHYQKKGIGENLLKTMLDKYKNYKTKVLVSYNPQVSFYEKYGFEKQTDKTPMFKTSM